MGEKNFYLAVLQLSPCCHFAVGRRPTPREREQMKSIEPAGVFRCCVRDRVDVVTALFTDEFGDLALNAGKIAFVLVF